MMADIPYHTHDFSIPTATPGDVATGTSDSVVLTPASVQSKLAALDAADTAASNSITALNNGAAAARSIATGGTGATTASGARTNLGALGLADLGPGTRFGDRNRIVNGQGLVNQRTYTTVADDVYWCDRHYVLTQTAAITPTVITSVPTGFATLMRLTQSQAAAQRMGNAQIIESADTATLRGKTATLMLNFRSSTTANVRYAVLEWTGTADVVTSDMVNDWTSGSYTAGGFFLAANLVVRAVGVTAAAAASAMTFATLTAAIGSTANNIIVLYWTEATAAQNVTVDMAWALVEGDASIETALPPARVLGVELTLCLRRYQLITASYAIHAGATATNYFQTITVAQQMASTPSIAIVTTGSLVNIAASVTTPLNAGSFYVGFSAAAVGVASFIGRVYELNSEL